MAKIPQEKISLYDIATVEDLRRRMLANMPEGTQHKRQVACRMSPDPAGWFAMDPAYFQPNAGGADSVGAVFPALTGPARIIMDLLVTPEFDAVVAAVEINLRDEEPTHRRELDSNVAVDSRKVMIAAASRVEKAWKVGGPLCGVNLLHAHDLLMEKPESAREISLAVQELKDAGFALSKERSHWHFVGPVSDKDISEAREVLRKKAPGVDLNINRSETRAMIDSKLKSKAVACLEDDGELYAIVFSCSGGIYWWDELLAQDQVVGYRMSFFDDDQVEGDE